MSLLFRRVAQFQHQALLAQFNQLMQFYKQADLASTLDQLQVAPEIKDFILSLPNETKSHYIAAIKKNPSQSLQELQSIKLPATHIKSKGDEIDEKAYLLSLNSFIPAEMQHWAKMQLLQARHRDPNPTKEKYPLWFKLWQWFQGHESFSEHDPSLHEVKDWFNNEHPNLATLTLQQVLDFAEAWHQAQAAEGANKTYQEGTTNIVYTFPNNWTIRKIKTDNDLAVEGNLMNHCVGSYCDVVEVGEANIYSLRDPQNKPHVTMETGGNNYIFNQLQGNSNSQPKKEYLDMVYQWLHTLPGAKIKDNQDFWIEDDSNPKNLAQEIKDFYLQPFRDISRLDIQSLAKEAEEKLERFLDNTSYRNFYPFMDDVADSLAEVAIQHDIRELASSSGYYSDKQAITPEVLQQSISQKISYFRNRSAIIGLSLYISELIEQGNSEAHNNVSMQNLNETEYDEQQREYAENTFYYQFANAIFRHLQQYWAAGALPKYKWLQDLLKKFGL